MYKMALTDSPLTLPSDPAPASASGATEPDEIRLSCLVAIRNLYATFLTIPVGSLFHLPIFMSGTLGHADAALARLMAFWNGRLPDNAPADFPSFADMMERLAGRYESAKSAPHPFGWAVQNDVFDLWAARFRSFKALNLSPPPPAPPAPPPLAPEQPVVVPGVAVAEPAVALVAAAEEETESDWATWLDGIPARWFAAGQQEPAGWQGSYDMWNIENC